MIQDKEERVEYPLRIVAMPWTLVPLAEILNPSASPAAAPSPPLLPSKALGKPRGRERMGDQTAPIPIDLSIQRERQAKHSLPFNRA